MAEDGGGGERDLSPTALLKQKVVASMDFHPLVPRERLLPNDSVNVRIVMERGK